MLMGGHLGRTPGKLHIRRDRGTRAFRSIRWPHLKALKISPAPSESARVDRTGPTRTNSDLVGSRLRRSIAVVVGRIRRVGCVIRTIGRIAVRGRAVPASIAVRGRAVPASIAIPGIAVPASISVRSIRCVWSIRCIWTIPPVTNVGSTHTNSEAHSASAPASTPLGIGILRPHCQTNDANGCENGNRFHGRPPNFDLRGREWCCRLVTTGVAR